MISISLREALEAEVENLAYRSVQVGRKIAQIERVLRLDAEALTIPRERALVLYQERTPMRLSARFHWKFRLFAKWLVRRLHLAGLAGLIEYCQDCGIRQPLVWYAADDLWFSVTGNVGGVLCPECFDRRARQAGLGLVRWTPTLDERSAP